MTVSGPGLLVRENGAFVNIYAPKSGWLESYPNRGDSVTAGELIARLSAPEEEGRLTDATDRVAQLKQQRSDLVARFTERLANEQRVTQRKREALEEIIHLDQARVRDLQALLEARESLQARNLIPTDRVLEARERMLRRANRFPRPTRIFSPLTPRSWRCNPSMLRISNCWSGNCATAKVSARRSGSSKISPRRSTRASRGRSSSTR